MNTAGTGMATSFDHCKCPAGSRVSIRDSRTLPSATDGGQGTCQSKNPIAGTTDYCTYYTGDYAGYCDTSTDCEWIAEGFTYMAQQFKTQTSETEDCVLNC